MTDLAKMKADAEEIDKLDWFGREELLLNTDIADKYLPHIANCDPQTILKLLAVVEAAKRLLDDEGLPNQMASMLVELDDTLSALKSKTATGTQGVEL